MSSIKKVGIFSSPFERKLYIKRLRHMFPNGLSCPALYIQNHLLGLCTTCGQGRYSDKKRKVQLHTVLLDRLYTVLSIPTSSKLLYKALALFPSLVTNAEYPVPMVEYNHRLHVPMFYDRATNTVLDFVPKTMSKYLIKATEDTLSSYGFNYIIYDLEFNVLAQRLPDKNTQIVNSLKHLLTSLIDKNDS